MLSMSGRRSNPATLQNRHYRTGITQPGAVSERVTALKQLLAEPRFYKSSPSFYKAEF